MAFALKVSMSASASSSSSSSSPPWRSAQKQPAARVSLKALPAAQALEIPLKPAETVQISLKARAPTAPLSAPAVPVGKCNISQTFSRLREQGKAAFIPYITAGDPDLETTARALRLLDSCGADVIELGIPYSDPIADGPVIQASASRALASGTTLDGIMSMLKEVTPELSCPVALFTYCNLILKHGVANFMATTEEAGAHGLIVPDLPLEEAGVFRTESIQNNLEMVQLTTPVTTTEKMKEITKASQGFVYLVSVVGVTGARTTVNPHVQCLLREIKQVTNKAVAVGFGISTPEHVRQIVEWGADGVIIGSAMVRQLGEAASREEGLRRLEEYAKSLKAALP